jgi:hypothetical protein
MISPLRHLAGGILPALALLLLTACGLVTPTNTPQPTPTYQTPFGEEIDFVATLYPQARTDATPRYDPQGPDRDCDDFDTPEELLVFFRAANPDADPHQLDEDRDGLPCDLGKD